MVQTIIRHFKLLHLWDGVNIYIQYKRLVTISFFCLYANLQLHVYVAYASSEQGQNGFI